ncbi:MAG: family hydrolase [Microbacteriaceae bacterium]|jgi:putative hydrolase of the HAD superfamily|nr:family hydrolase [Microbacteriaceae bacterium]
MRTHDLDAVVLFDLDDTLFAHRRSVRLGIAAHRAAIGNAVAAANEDLEHARWHSLEELHYTRYLRGELDFLGQRRARARDFVAPFDLDLADDDAADRWFDDYLAEYERSWSLHDDALPCLDALEAAGGRIGIITNGDIHFQTSKIERVGLAPRIEHVIASGDLGFAKPDPRIFRHACAVFGVTPSNAVYVGDRLNTDAIGAADAGLRGVWLDRSGAADASELASAAASGVLVINSLDELLPALTG